MDYRQFHELMAGKAAVQTGALQELLREYPYCQAGHLLLVKTFHEQQHIRYEPALRTAAAHQPDRRVLYRIVHAELQATTESVFRDEVAAVPESPFLESSPPDTPIPIGEQPPQHLTSGVFADHYQPEATVEATEPPAFSPVQEEPQEAIINPHIQEEPWSVPAESAPLNEDPREVLRRRLAELLGEASKEIPATPSGAEIDSKLDVPSDTQEPAFEAPSIAPAGLPDEDTEEITMPNSEPTFPNKKEERTTAETIVRAESSSLQDGITREELSVALEETLLHELELLPALESTEAEQVTMEEPAQLTAEVATTGDSGFIAWLRSQSVSGFGQVEAVHADDFSLPAAVPDITTTLAPRTDTAPTPLAGEQSVLIDKFIAEEPRIVPSKTEFFNPVVQAKRSVEEHEDVVSETLAGIYAAQGNLLKARTAYQRLGLLHPEKSAYFAALVREMDEKLNTSSSEDL